MCVFVRLFFVSLKEYLHWSFFEENTTRALLLSPCTKPFLACLTRTLSTCLPVFVFLLPDCPPTHPMQVGWIRGQPQHIGERREEAFFCSLLS